MKAYVPFLPLLLLVPRLAFAKSDSQLSRIVQELHLEELHQPAPEVLYRDAAGKTAKLSDEKGHFVLLHLWASWCVPCRKEMPSLVAFTRKLKDPSLKLLLISVDTSDKEAEAAKILKKSAPDERFFQIVRDANSERYYGWGIPMTYVITPDGKIAARAAGCKEWDKISALQFKDLLNAAKKEM